MTYLEITLFITTCISITGWIVNARDRIRTEKQLDISSECCNRYLKRIRLLEGEILVLRLDTKPKHLQYPLTPKDCLKKYLVFYLSEQSGPGSSPSIEMFLSDKTIEELTNDFKKTRPYPFLEKSVYERWYPAIDGCEIICANGNNDWSYQLEIIEISKIK